MIFIKFIFKIIKTIYYFKLMDNFHYFDIGSSDNKSSNNIFTEDKPYNRVDQMKAVQNEGLNYLKKNADYGDAFANYGVVGVLSRMGDKISRLQSITTKCVSLVNTESFRDTLIDLHNYSAMAIMLLDEDKKEKNISIRAPPPSPISKDNYICIYKMSENFTFESANKFINDNIDYVKRFKPFIETKITETI